MGHIETLFGDALYHEETEKGGFLSARSATML